MLELSDRTEDLEGEHALRRRGVDRIAQRAEVGTAVGQLLDDGEEVADGPRQAIEADDDQDVASADLSQQPGEGRAGARGTRSVFDDEIAASGCTKLLGLGVGLLFFGGDTGIAHQTAAGGLAAACFRS